MPSFDDPWPKPQDMVDDGWDASERPGAAGYLDRDVVASYLERGFIARAYMGMSRAGHGSKQWVPGNLTDGTFLWPEGLTHYVRDHAVRICTWSAPQLLVKEDFDRGQDLDGGPLLGLSAGERQLAVSSPGQHVTSAVDASADQRTVQQSGLDGRDDSVVVSVQQQERRAAGCTRSAGLARTAP